MKLPINIQTKEGIESYHAVKTQYEWSKKYGLDGWFSTYLAISAVKKEKSLIDWSDNYDLGSIEFSSPVWKEWKVRADEVACMNYFIRRK